MVMTEGNTATNENGTEQPNYVGPSAKDISEAFAQSLKANGLQVIPAQQQAQAPPQKSAYDAFIESMEADPDADKDQLALHKAKDKALIDTIKKEVLSEAKQTTARELMAQRETDASAYIEDVLENIFEDEEPGDRAKIVRFIRSEIKQEFEEGRHNELAEAILKGERKRDDLKSLAKKHAEAFSKIAKKEKSKTQGVSGLSGGASSAQAIAAAKNAPSSDDVKDLNSSQREQYYARKRSCVSAGFSPEDAHKEAMRSARAVK